MEDVVVRILLSLFALAACLPSSAQAIDNGPLYASSVQVLYKGGGGSGVVVKSDGKVSLILTAKHVVKDAEAIRVRSRKGEWDAKIIEIFEQDGALLEVHAPMIPTCLPLPEERPGPGSSLSTIGCPYGTCDTRTDGYLTKIEDGVYLASVIIASGGSGGGVFWYSPNKRWVLVGIARGMFSNNLALFGMMGPQLVSVPIPSINIITPLDGIPELWKFVRPTPLDRW